MGHSDWLRKETWPSQPKQRVPPGLHQKSQRKQCSFTGAAEMMTSPPFGDKTACIKGEERQIQSMEGCVLSASLWCHINPTSTPSSIHYAESSITLSCFYLWSHPGVYLPLLLFFFSRAPTSLLYNWIILPSIKINLLHNSLSVIQLSLDKSHLSIVFIYSFYFPAHNPFIEGLPQRLNGKESACVQEMKVQSLGWEDPLE